MANGVSAETAKRECSGTFVIIASDGQETYIGYKYQCSDCKGFKEKKSYKKGADGSEIYNFGVCHDPIVNNPVNPEDPNIIKIGLGGLNPTDLKLFTNDLLSELASDNSSSVTVNDVLTAPGEISLCDHLYQNEIYMCSGGLTCGNAPRECVSQPDIAITNGINSVGLGNVLGCSKVYDTKKGIGLCDSGYSHVEKSEVFTRDNKGVTRVSWQCKEPVGKAGVYGVNPNPATVDCPAVVLKSITKTKTTLAEQLKANSAASFTSNSYENLNYQTFLFCKAFLNANSGK